MEYLIIFDLIYVNLLKHFELLLFKKNPHVFVIVLPSIKQVIFRLFKSNSTLLSNKLCVEAQYAITILRSLPHRRGLYLDMLKLYFLHLAWKFCILWLYSHCVIYKNEKEFTWRGIINVRLTYDLIGPMHEVAFQKWDWVYKNPSLSLMCSPLWPTQQSVTFSYLRI